ncbi:DUF2017 family protein [Cellulomonas marina]|uniref:Uncharacterized protein n=1 Tax=Cellulomonas marina TaxID=988821 RepID=A0A1I0V6E2_9CELL|nr:DUF2017 family protein [Cellulomonas marina]GIG28351.1 hypothetical protein Cma02nite_09510 [Cellulomonas marina]SFA71617.1 protein of unknown function [Cellulomonas marina]
MRDFRRERDHFVARLDATERQVVGGVLADVAFLLGAQAGPDGGPLLPDEARALRSGADGGGAGGGAGAPDEARLPDWSTEAVPVPDDPAVRRLLPDASPDEPEVAAEFRRLTEADLRATKITRLVRLFRAVVRGTDGWAEGDLVVAPADAAEVAAALTDVRLVLADRLGLETDAQVDALYAELDGRAADRARRWRARGGRDRPTAEEEAAERSQRALGAVYGALTWWQETLVTLLSCERRR